MDKKNILFLQDLQKRYKNGENIIHYLKSCDQRTQNSISDIMLSYDLQAGTYSKHLYENYDMYIKKGKVIADLFADKLDLCDVAEGNWNILEAGVGEASSLVPLLMQSNICPRSVYAFDISWSRIKYAKRLVHELIHDTKIESINLFVGDLFSIPLEDNSIDVVYTVHALEPNGGYEKQLLQELYRVASKYILLIEPAYEFATEEQRKRMEYHGYIKNLYASAIELGYNVICHEPMNWKDCSLENDMNKAALLIIQKERSASKRDNTLYLKPFCCPITKEKITQQTTSVFFSENSLFAYPVIEGVPYLLPSHAIPATHFMDFPIEED